MGLKRVLKYLLETILKRYDYGLVENYLLYDWQKFSIKATSQNRKLPEGAEDYLRQDNPNLKELQEKYSKLDRNVIEPLIWTDNHIKPDDLKYFRGDNAYVWQFKGRNMNILAYALTTYYVKAIDNLGLLKKLVEDDYFGIYTFLIDDKKISRDLLDSIIELYFLEKHLKISDWRSLNILDIGAGYGRLAYRTVSALENINKYFCIDAVPISTFISEYYLFFRNVQDKAEVIPLYNVEKTLTNNDVDIAINVHSFSECTISAIEWWLNVLEKKKIKYLMIVPNSLNHGGKLLLTNHYQDFSKIIGKHGYKLIAEEPKYRDSVLQEYGINPTYHYLFELS